MKDGNPLENQKYACRMKLLLLSVPITNPGISVSATDKFYSHHSFPIKIPSQCMLSRTKSPRNFLISSPISQANLHLLAIPIQILQRLNSSVGKSLSSYFSFVVPQSGNENSESCPPLPIRSESYESIENCKNEQNQGGNFISSGEDKESDKVGELRSNDDIEWVKQMRELTESSVFISANLCEFLQASLPNIVRGCKWILLYSTLKHGISMRTLLRRSGELPGPCLLVAGDKQGAVFGALLECPLRPTPKRKYQGTSQTFLFTTIYGEPHIFRPTGANRYYLMCMNEFLAFGGGGNFALCLDEDLLKATSGPSETFGNECLASSTEFELKNVELWGFAHASQYLSS